VTTARVFDLRKGIGQVPAGTVEMPTLLVPGTCICTWSVVRPGRGLKCRSQLRYRSSLCSVRHERVAAAVL
jgi:hypothetical protein